MRLYGQPAAAIEETVPQHEAERYENDAGRYWDLFYKRNTDRFFKDRHYFDREFPQLTRGRLVVLEVGCGAGNSVFPLLDINPETRVYACDFAPRAVELVKAHPAYASGRVTAFVADITQHQGPGSLAQHLPGRCVDYASMVFVLSAVAPQHMHQALCNVASVLKPGQGRVLFRDYAEGDLAQDRLEVRVGPPRHIRGRFYARGDGTCAYYFEQEELSALFATAGFVCEASLVYARVIENRASGARMPRRWVQAVFRYDPDAAAAQQQQHQQQAMPLQPQPEGLQAGGAVPAVLGSTSSAAGRGTCTCAGRAWSIPQDLAVGGGAGGSRTAGPAGSSGPGICAHVELLAALVAQRQLSLQGQCVVILPPWLRLAAAVDGGSDDTDTTCSNEALQQLLQGQQQRMPRLCCCCDAAPGRGDGVADGPARRREAAAAVALLALAAVWLGARRVVVCLPGLPLPPSSGGQQQPQAAPEPGGSVLQQQQRGAAAACSSCYGTVVQEVVGANEGGVVAERLRLRHWRHGDARHAAALQRELLGMLSGRAAVPCRGLLLVGTAAAACAKGCCCCCCASSTDAGAVKALWQTAASTGQMLLSPL